MAKKQDNTGEDQDVQEVDAAPPSGKKSMPILIRKQFVKDISFECPNSPAILDIRGKPEMDVNFNMNAVPMEKSDDEGRFYEVTLGLQAQAKRDGKLGFIAEIEYGMEVKILNGVPENRRHAMLYIEMPRYAFPFVRQILSNLTQMGGFPPLLLTPIDFRSLYLDRFGKEAEMISDAEKETA